MENIVLSKIVSLVSPQKIILFGSQAMGTQTVDSDYDLLVLIDGVVNKRKTAQQLYRDLLPYNVAIDLIIDTPENFEKNKNEKSFIYYQINKTGKVIYEKDQKRTDLD